MTTDHAAWRERVLAYEELDPAERAETDAHLAWCASCRELLHRLRTREALARTEGQLPLEPAALADQDAAGERSSAERLLLKLAAPPGTPAPRLVPRAEEPGGRPKPARARLPIWAWAAPAAAAAALAIVFLGRPGRDPAVAPRLGPLSIEHATAMRGSSDPAYHTGDAFSIRFELTATARPIVVALDDSGNAEVLYPPADSAARLFGPGFVVLPDSAGAEAWTFVGPPGRETFLAGALRSPAVDVPSLRAELARAVAGAPDRAGRVRAARTVLEKRADSVGELTVSHAAPASP